MNRNLDGWFRCLSSQVIAVLLCSSLLCLMTVSNTQAAPPLKSRFNKAARPSASIGTGQQGKSTAISKWQIGQKGGIKKPFNRAAKGRSIKKPFNDAAKWTPPPPPPGGAGKPGGKNNLPPPKTPSPSKRGF